MTPERIAEDGNPVTKGLLCYGNCQKVLAERDSLREENARLQERDQRWIDDVCHYRNLAILLGAKPEQMVSQWDRDLCEKGIEVDRATDALMDVAEVWDDNERLESENARLQGELAALREVLAFQDKTVAVARSIGTTTGTKVEIVE
jgi:FtsZ-binding cell division protein ZapB